MITHRYQHGTVELCRKCQGHGIIYKYPEWDKLGHTEATPYTCDTCQGSGRVVVSRVTKIEVVPFLPTNTEQCADTPSTAVPA